MIAATILTQTVALLVLAGVVLILPALARDLRATDKEVGDS